MHHLLHTENNTTIQVSPTVGTVPVLPACQNIHPFWHLKPPKTLNRVRHVLKQLSHKKVLVLEFLGTEASNPLFEVKSFHGQTFFFLSPQYL